MRNAILIGLVALVGFCLFVNRGSSAEDVAKRSIEALNAHDYPTMWSLMSSQSKQAMELQLTNNRTNPLGRQLIVQFGIPESQIAELTPYTYFVAIMRFAEMNTPPADWESRFRSIDLEEDFAIVHWDKRNASGTARLVREGSEWKIVANVY